MKGLFFLVFLLFGSLADAAVNTTQPSCIPAQPAVDANLQRQQCLPYQYPNGYCKPFLGNSTLFASKSVQKVIEYSFQSFDNGRKALEKNLNILVSKECLKVFNEVSCPGKFPKCDVTSSMPTGRPLCKETCEHFTRVCAKELEMAKEFNKQQSQSGYVIKLDFINCTELKYRNGGENPECYYPKELNTETDKLQDEGCYYGNGLGYRGNVSVTRSGHVCQSWSSQCPHRHNHPLSEYPELINASNWCRNPGGQAPNGPWCYTTSNSTRWEYCNVRKCPAPAPTRSPEVVQAFSTGPYKISIEWRPIPLPFVHGTPRGFRIQISKLGGKDSMINTTSPDTKYFEIENLQPLTDYSLSVLEFNEIGDGPWSRSVYVQTMPQNFVAVRLSMILQNKKFDSSLYERNTTQYKVLESDIKSKLDKLFSNTAADGYNIFKTKIIRFFKGSVGVELDITAELLNSTILSATQDIAGRILKGSETSTLHFTSLLVKASPPPPVNLSQSDVSMTSVTVGWSAPADNEPFRITNYTVQYKKSGTKMSYYNAMIVGSDKSESVVENIDSNTKYLMRVVSINDYGSQPSEFMVVHTKARNQADLPIAAIVTPLVVMAIILIGAGIFFWRWWHKKREEELELKARIKRLSENPYESAVDWFDLLNINVIKKWWEVPRDDLTLENELGSGQFGVVLRGFLKNGEGGKAKKGMYCAVKMLKDNPTERELRDLCNEINIMSLIGDHPNIVSLIGACTVNGPPLLVVKFAPNGCLLEHIKENRPLAEYQNTRQDPEHMPKVISEKERLKFAYEIAQGMSHLEKHRYVHRDLAARNILLGKNMVAMVSDFGMSRDVYEIGMYENTAGGILPVRWMAIESLQDYTYNSETDVWSYGVLLWEIESGGIVPYGGLSGLEILEKLKQGYRLEKPRGTSRDLYSIMWKCWNPDPEQRPKFTDLVYQVGGLLSLADGEYDEVVINDIHPHDKGYAYDEVVFNDNHPHDKGYDEVVIDDNHPYDKVVMKEDEINLDEPLIFDKNAIPLDNIAFEMEGEGDNLSGDSLNTIRTEQYR